MRDAKSMLKSSVDVVKKSGDALGKFHTMNHDAVIEAERPELETLVA